MIFDIQLLIIHNFECKVTYFLNIMQVFLSFFKSPISNATPMCSVTVKQIHSYIVSNYAKESTETLRGLVNSSVRRAFKARSFDYVTFSGTFTRRQLSGLVSHSGLLCFDIDKIQTEERLQEIKSLLVNDEMLHTVLLFRSPSGDGLKWVIEVPDRHWLGIPHTDNNLLTKCPGEAETTLVSLSINRNIDPRMTQIITNHKVLYEQIRGYLLERYEIETDATSDIARSCYLCHDADAYFDEPNGECNPNCPFLESRDARIQITDKTSSGLQAPLLKQVRDIGDRRNDFDLVERLVSGIEHKRLDITGDYLDWVRLGFAFANAFGELGRGFYHRISQFHPHYNPNDANRQYDNCIKSNRGEVTLGTAIKQLRVES